MSNGLYYTTDGLANDMLEMVLFHDAFVALKSRSPLTVNCSPDDFILGKERKLLQEYVFAPFSMMVVV